MLISISLLLKQNIVIIIRWAFFQILTYMASSGLQENVVLTRTYLQWMVSIHVWQTLVPQGETGTPVGGPYFQYEGCVYPLCAIGEAHCGVVAKGYLKWRAGVSCRTSSQMWGSRYFPRFLLEGWVIDSNKHGLLDGPSTTVHFPV